VYGETSVGLALQLGLPVKSGAITFKKLSQNLPEERNTTENLQQDSTITGSKYFTSSS